MSSTPPSLEYNSESYRVTGILAYPALSRNNRVYFPAELARAHGRHLPIYDEHADLFEIDPATGLPVLRGGQPVPRQSPPPQPDGYVDVKFDDEAQVLTFDGEVTSDRLRKLIESGERRFVSLRADPEYYQRVEGPGGQPYYAPRNVRFVSVATTGNPGLPLAIFGPAAEGHYGESTQSVEEVTCEMCVVRPAPRLPTEEDAERLRDARRMYGLKGVTQAMRERFGAGIDWPLDNFPELRAIVLPELLNARGALAGSLESLPGVLVFKGSSPTSFEFWHEVGHVLLNAVGARSDEEYCNGFAVRMGALESKVPLRLLPEDWVGGA